MSKLEYHVYRCESNDDSPERRISLVTTESLDTAKQVLEERSLQDGIIGAEYVLEVSTRGNTAVLESKKINGTLCESTSAYDIDISDNEKDDKAEFHNVLCTLHNAGFSAGEIADVTGRTLRVIQYNLQKLKSAGKIKPHGPGRPIENTVREKRPVLIQLYVDNYDYLLKTVGNVSSVVNDLVDKYRKEIEDSKKD